MRPAGRPPPRPAAPGPRPVRAGVPLGPGRREQPLRPAAGFGGQHRRALQERGRRGQAAAGLGPAGRTLQLGGDVLVGPGRGLGPVPGPAVGIDLQIGDLGQRTVHGLPVPQRRGPVGRRPHQRVPEPHVGAELDQAGLRSRAWPPRRGCRAVPRPARPPEAGRPDRPRRAAAGAGSRRAGRRAAAGSSPRSARSAAPHRAARIRPPAAPVTPRAAAPATPAGCPASPPRSGRGRAHPAARSGPNPAVPARRPRAALPRPAAAIRPVRHRGTGPRRSGRPAPRPGGAPRTPGPAPRRDRATAGHRRGRSAGAYRPRPTAGSARPTRPGNGPARDQR